MSSLSSPDSMNVFDRRLLSQRRDRAAARWDDYGFLVQETAERLAERLEDVTRSFTSVLDLGCHGGEMAALLSQRPGLERFVQCDLSPAMAARAKGRAPTVVADEEGLPFGDKAFDLVVSNLSLHWVNDLPGAFLQVRKSLQDDGLFAGCLLGGETLRELRSCLIEAEMELEGGVSPRVSPFAQIKDVGDLLRRAGLTMPVVDSDIITIDYENPMRLLDDLRGMGESNLVKERRKTFMRRQTLFSALQRYQEHFALPNGRFRATFEVIFFVAWTPHPNQPKPLAPGSAQTLLSDALKKDEEPS